MTIALLILAAVAAIVLITRMNKNSKDEKRKRKLDYHYARIFNKAKGVEGYLTMKQ